MPNTIHIPAPLRSLTAGQASVEAAGVSVGDLLAALTTLHPPLRQQLFTPEGRLRSFVNLYLNDEDIRYSGGEATPVHDGDTLAIIPAIAGG